MPTPTQMIDLFDSDGARDEEFSDNLTGLEGIARREAVNHPSHYNAGKIEVIDAIDDWKLDFNAGNVVKYVARHQHKANPLEDLKKARWYLDRLIERTENGSQ
jgi:predicted 2-oxoglutarate/Fe(II)-dependent dioxygenase YbiX